MAPEDETALEAEEEVLPDRLDPVEPPAVEALGQALHCGAGMRSLDVDALADERLQPPGDAVERISFGHAGKPTIQS
jgi:hypothetical protein